MAQVIANGWCEDKQDVPELASRIESAITEAVADAQALDFGVKSSQGFQKGPTGVQESRNVERSDDELPGDAECRCGNRESEHAAGSAVPELNPGPRCLAYRCACNRFELRPA